MGDREGEVLEKWFSYRKAMKHLLSCSTGKDTQKQNLIFKSYESHPIKDALGASGVQWVLGKEGEKSMCFRTMGTKAAPGKGR